MFCSKCGAESPEHESKLCEACRAKTDTDLPVADMTANAAIAKREKVFSTLVFIAACANGLFALLIGIFAIIRPTIGTSFLYWFPVVAAILIARYTQKDNEHYKFFIKVITLGILVVLGLCAVIIAIRFLSVGDYSYLDLL